MDEQKKQDEVLSPAQLEARLGNLRGFSLLCKAVMVIFLGVTVYFFIAASGIFPGLLFLIPAGIAYVFASQQDATIKELLVKNVITGVLNEVFENVEYRPYSHMPDEIIQGSGMVFPFFYNRIEGSDHIKATYRGLSLELGDVELSEYYKSEEDNSQSSKTYFKGQWLTCSFDRKLNADVHLSENTRELRKQHRGEGIKLENEAFNSRFMVLSENEQDAYYVLTPHMMEYLLAAADKAGGQVYMSFLRDGKLNIAAHTKHNFFELGGSSTNVEALHAKFLEELRWFTDIVDEIYRENAGPQKESDS